MILNFNMTYQYIKNAYTVQNKEKFLIFLYSGICYKQERGVVYGTDS